MSIGSIWSLGKTISLNHFSPLLILWYRYTIYSLTKCGHQLMYMQTSEILTKLYQKQYHPSFQNWYGRIIIISVFFFFLTFYLHHLYLMLKSSTLGNLPSLFFPSGLTTELTSLLPMKIWISCLYSGQ